VSALDPTTRPRPGRRRRLVFIAVAMTLALAVPGASLVAVDVYLHSKYQTSAGFNIWGYRGPVVGRKRPGEYRVVIVGGSSAFGYGVNWYEAIPPVLERALRARAGRPVSVVNLGYNNEGAYSMKFTLQDYAYLDYDLACLYEGYNDLIGDPRTPNLSVFRHDSPVFRLTGYLPIFPIIFKEKAAALLHGGDVSSLYRDSDKTMFRPSIAERAAAGVLDATATVGQSLERQLDRVTREPQRRIVGASSTSCRYPWQEYCHSILDAVDYAIGHGHQALVVTQPYHVTKNLRARHQDQQRELAAVVGRVYGKERRVRYVDLGNAVDLSDTSMSFDTMHLTPPGNKLVAEALVDPVLQMAAQRPPPAR
jgi:hypothetical protein